MCHSSLMPLPLYFYVLILSQILSIREMVKTRNHHANANNENNPPLPPNFEQVLLMQAEMLQTMQQTMANMHQGQGHQHALQPHPCDKLGGFQRIKPSTFHTLLSQWMLMIGLKPLKRNFKSCNATIERWFCSPHINSRDQHSTGGMCMLMHLRSPTT
jgi:hypothetical protein